MRRLLPLIAAAVLASALTGQNTWRGRRPALRAVTESEVRKPMQPCDSTKVSASGFEKPLRSGIESFFLTNHTADTITRVHLRLEYFDETGRQLHSREEYKELTLPPRSTRLVELKSFDHQGVFYYHLSTKPRTRANATPFRVRLGVDSLEAV